MTALLQLLVPFVRKGLIEGVYESSAGEVPPSGALQEMIAKMGVWVSEAEPQEAALSPLPPTYYGRVGSVSESISSEVSF